MDTPHYDMRTSEQQALDNCLAIAALILAFLILAGCAGNCKPTVAVPVYCTATLPPPPDLSCPSVETDSDQFRCQKARDTALVAYAEAMAKALKACRKPVTP